MLLRIAENIVFASKKSFQKNKQLHADKPRAANKVMCVEYFYAIFSSLAQMFFEKQKKTQNSLFYPQYPFYPHHIGIIFFRPDFLEKLHLPNETMLLYENLLQRKNFVKLKKTQLFYLGIKLTKLYQRLVRDEKLREVSVSSDNHSVLYSVTVLMHVMHL